MSAVAAGQRVRTRRVRSAVRCEIERFELHTQLSNSADSRGSSRLQDRAAIGANNIVNEGPRLTASQRGGLCGQLRRMAGVGILIPRSDWRLVLAWCWLEPAHLGERESSRGYHGRSGGRRVEDEDSWVDVQV